MKTKIYLLGVAAAAVIASGCSDKWDEHYGDGPSATGVDSTVYEMIKNDSQLSVFGEMVDRSGYASLLNTSQTFTVWAPVNSALSDVDLEDEAEVKRVVANHIARFNVSTATNAEKGVRMYNGKMLYFDGMTFGGVAIDRADIMGSNGVLHTMTERIPYAYNIREYIDTHAETSRLSAFLKRFDEKKFDAATSVPIDIDENGNTIYDSVLVSYNRLFEHEIYGLGNIQSEDSVFTMLVPDNTAWEAAYNRIRPLYNVYDADAEKADSIADTQTSLAVIRDLIFRARITDPSGVGGVFATSGSKITHVGMLFGGSSPVVASNGMIYLSSAIDYPVTETYNPVIRVEAEDATGRVRGTGTTIYTRVANTDSPYAPEISEGSYIEVSATSVSRQPSVTFEIPNTLSGSYDIYAVFVPTAIDDASVTTDATRLSFVVACRGDNGRNKEQKFADNGFVTSGDAMTTIRIAEGFQFPVSNFYDSLWMMEDGNDLTSRTVSTRITVTTNVSNAEFNNGTLSRRYRIDCIYLVPSNL